MPPAHAPPTIDPTPPTDRTWREARGQIAAIGLAVVLVAGLFTYMTLHSGPDRERQEQLRAADRRAAAQPGATLAPIATTSTVVESTSILPGGPGDPTYAFADIARFCGGARGMDAYELRISAGVVEGDWRVVQRTLVDGRAAWRRSVDDLAAGAAPYLVADVDRYRTAYEALIDGAANATSAEEIQGAFQSGYSFALRRSGKKINAAIGDNCRVG